jgi:hypothetical protein
MAAQRPSSPHRTALGAAVGVAALARAAGGRLLAAARGETGRRLARAVTLSVALAVLITTLYDRGETPRAAAQPAVAAGAPAGAAGPGRAAGRRGRPRPPAVGERPAAVAAAWYAARQGVPATKVDALQQDRVSAREVRVLVLADHGHGRLRTALVRVRLGPAGWSVR